MSAMPANDTVQTTPGRLIYERPALLATKPTSYCPGCGHGIVHRVLAEVARGAGPRASGRSSWDPVGCSVFAYDYLRLDAVESPHGRAAGGGHRREALPAGPDRVHVPGRRRPRGHRDGGDRPRRGPRRAVHDDLRQQRHLRDDRRPDGPDHPHRPEDDIEPVRSRRVHGRLSAPRDRDALAAAGRRLRGARIGGRPRAHRQDEGRDQAGVRGPAGGQRASRSSRCCPRVPSAGA